MSVETKEEVEDNTPSPLTFTRRNTLASDKYSSDFITFTATFLVAQVRGMLARIAYKKKCMAIPRVIQVRIEGAKNLLSVHEALNSPSSASSSDEKTTIHRRPSLLASLASNFTSELPHSYVVINAIRGHGNYQLVFSIINLFCFTSNAFVQINLHEKNSSRKSSLLQHCKNYHPKS